MNSVFSALRSATSDREGGFVLPRINPGRYTIYAKATSTAGTPLWGISDVEVDGHDVTRPIMLAPGVTFSGRIVFDGSLPRPSDVAAIMPVLSETRASPLMTGLARRTASADGTFSYTVAPGAYRLGSTLWSSAQTSGWRLRSVVVNGSDISDVIFDIRADFGINNVVMTFTDRPTQLSGTLLDSAGRPSAEYDLIVFSVDRRAWLPATRRTRHVRPDVDGRFVIHGLPAGEYFLCALTDVEQGRWDDATFLAELAATAPMRFLIGDGETKSLSVQVDRR